MADKNSCREWWKSNIALKLNSTISEIGGKSGSVSFVRVFDKILKKEIKSRNLCTLIEVDGGINEITAKIAAKNGADICVAGTSIFKSNDMKFAIDSLK